MSKFSGTARGAPFSLQMQAPAGSDHTSVGKQAFLTAADFDRAMYAKEAAGLI